MNNRYDRRMYPIWGMFPGFIVYALFFVLPFLMALYYSFTAWNFYTARFVGFENYIDFFRDPLLSIALKNTVIFTVVTAVFKVGFGMLLALFVNQKLKSTHFVRTVFFLPSVLNTIAIGILFSALLHPTNGLINLFFGWFQLDFLQLKWLTDKHLAIYAISAIEVWKWSGYNMIIILAGLQSVGKEYYESAAIDGANAWRRFWKITFPLILPAFNVALVGNLIGGLKVFDLVAATTGGGPGRATEVLNTVIFQSFGRNLQGLASAGNVVLCLFVVFVTLITYLLIRRKEVEQ